MKSEGDHMPNNPGSQMWLNQMLYDQNGAGDIWPLSSGLKILIILERLKVEGWSMLCRLGRDHPATTTPWAQWPGEKKHNWGAVELIHREKSHQKTMIHKFKQMHKHISRLSKRELKQMRGWSECVNVSCITKTQSICMVVLMRHQHKTQYKPSKFIIITASPCLYN